MVKWARAAIGAAILFVVVTVVALAQEGGELVPIVDRLPEQIFLFGASGGAIVSLLLSILKHFRIVGQDGIVPTQAANFTLSVLVAAAAGVLGGQSFGAALLTAFTSMVAASGLHETVGHAAQKLAGNR